ncbi:MAG: peptidase S9, partial [Cyclobacteriaceae bacterium]|nr:peptidase S9 [Cyclobacteriaceae bacterium]
MKNLITFLLIFSVCVPLFSQNTDWKPEDIIHTKYVSGAAFSPNSSMVVWTQRKGLTKEDKFVNDIYLTRLDMLKDGKPRSFQLTNSDDSDFNTIFSRDGEFIYFLSSREKGKKLWRLNLYGGEPEKVQDFENGISNMDWLNNQEIIFKAEEGKTLYDITYEKDNTVIVEDSTHWNAERLYSFNIKSKEIKRLT